MVVGADEYVEHQFHDESRDVWDFGVLFEKLGFLLQQHALQLGGNKGQTFFTNTDRFKTNSLQALASILPDWLGLLSQGVHTILRQVLRETL